MLNDSPKVTEKFHSSSSSVSCFKKRGGGRNGQINLRLKLEGMDILMIPNSFVFTSKTLWNTYVHAALKILLFSGHSS